MPDTVEQLAARAVADPAARPAVLRALVRAGNPVAALRALAPGGPHLGLEFVARLPDPVPLPLVGPTITLLADREVPPGVRLAAAGKLLEGADAATTAAVVRPLVAGLADARRLDRLLALQRRVDRCDPLDRLIEQAEASLVVPCPRCGERFTRPGLVGHLWDRHRLRLIDGQPADPRPLAEAAYAEAAADPTGEATDRAFLLSRHLYPTASPGLVLETLARDSADPANTDHLRQRAADEGCGVCPRCLTAVPDPLPPLPPPADVAPGRVAADGFAAAVSDGPLGRTVTLHTPAGRREPPDGPRMPPRLLATAVALPAFAVGLFAVLVLPARVVHPLAAGGLAVVAGWTAYLFAGAGRKPLPDPTDAAIELAWKHLAVGVGRSPAAVRFLVRLCRVSVGAGDPGPRAGTVHELTEQAAVLDRKGGNYSQLAAAAAVLRASDLARLGREPVSGLVEVFRPFARGQASAGYAEAAAELVLADCGLPADDLLRLGVGVAAVLFDGGLTPPDVLLVGRFCPWLRKLVPAADADHLAELFAVWQLAGTKGWAAVGPAATVFDLAANNPVTARRLLAAHPDVLLRLDLGDAATAAVGTAVLSTRGLAVGGLRAVDPDDRLEAVKTAAGWRLLVGGGVLPADAPIPAKLPDQLRAWLIWRAGRLLPQADAALSAPPTPAAADRLLGAAADCPLCGARCLVRTGRVGTPWTAVAGD